MIICRNVLNKNDLHYVREQVDSLIFIQSSAKLGIKHKNNYESANKELGEFLQDKIADNSKVQRHAWMLDMTLPRINKYVVGQHYNPHVDFVMQRGLISHLSYTLFISDINEYVGGELKLGEDENAKLIKLPAGDMILYNSGQVHSVLPVVSGVRLAAVGWMQSLIPCSHHRETVAMLADEIKYLEDHHNMNSNNLSAVFSNLIREWSR